MENVTKLALTDAQRAQIIDHARSGLPHEVCGLIGGWEGVATLVIPIPNIAATPRTRYLLDPSAFIVAYRQIERNASELIGIYHSHPNGRPIPSAVDIAEASWPDAAYVIVGFPDGETPQIAAWLIQRGLVAPVELMLG